MTTVGAMRVTYDEELALISDVLEACGAPAEKARTQARWLTEADLRGHPSHGIQRLPVIVGRIRAGLIRVDASPEFQWRSASALVADGHRCFGPVGGLATVRELMREVSASGLALGAVRRANHLGLLAPYVEEVADAGLVGVAMTTSEALVHAWGGCKPVLGTNPIAIGIPSDPDPFVLDMATAAISMGKVVAHARAGTPLKEGWAIDRQGSPTVDPDAALRGAISPFGGAKGYGLGLAVELLVATLTGTALGSAVQGTLDTENESNKGDLFLVLDPMAFGGADFSRRLAAYLKEVRESGVNDGEEPVAIPGDRSRTARLTGLRAGFTIDREAWRDAQALLPRAETPHQIERTYP